MYTYVHSLENTEIYNGASRARGHDFVYCLNIVRHPFVWDLTHTLHSRILHTIRYVGYQKCTHLVRDSFV